MEASKISFGFSKIQKKINLFQKPANKPVQLETKVDFIKCVEDQSIKLVVEKIKEEEKPLVIVMKESSRTAASLASLQARHNILNGIIESTENRDDSKSREQQIVTNETLEQRAARELLESIQKAAKNTDENGTKVDIIPKPDELPLDGAEESTADDYESVPITKFGYAMLRGMGWKEVPKSKNAKNDDLMDEPMVRPKGMGLGADKIAKKKPPLVPPEPNEVLEIKKNACVRILGGKHKDLYGQIEGFDDHAGRIIVKLAVGGGYESLNEFLVQPVSKKEYAQYGKVINSAKYEEYKKKETAKSEPKIEDKRAVKLEPNSPQPATSTRKYSPETERERVRSHDRKAAATSENRRSDHHHSSRRRSRSRSASGQSSSDYHRKKSSKSKKKSKSSNHDRSRHRHNSSSEDDEKRHKKKTKKSKRPRSRSRGRHR